MTKIYKVMEELKFLLLGRQDPASEYFSNPLAFLLICHSKRKFIKTVKHNHGQKQQKPQRPKSIGADFQFIHG